MKASLVLVQGSHQVWWRASHFPNSNLLLGTCNLEATALLAHSLIKVDRFQLSHSFFRRCRIGRSLACGSSRHDLPILLQQVAYIYSENLESEVRIQSHASVDNV